MAANSTNEEALDDDAYDEPGTGFLGYVTGVLRTLLVTAFLICCIFIGGFLKFTADVAWTQPPRSPSADGIVVLTGGAMRIETALDLLKQGRAERLLISGVGAGTTAEDIAAINQDYADLFACCIDLDRGAENTIGNGTQSGRWARDLGFQSVLVVTSAYHIPRAMAEMRHASAGTHLIAYPVFHDGLDLLTWYQNWDTAKLLMSEYGKYLAALSRIAGKRLGAQFSALSG